MIPEIGHFALIMALCMALVQTFFPLVGAARNIPNWMAVARPAALGQGFFLCLAFVCLAYSFINNDFSVRYVAQNSNSALPLAYRISGVWGGHEGSMLLWTLMLGLWTTAVALFSRSLTQAMAARVLGVMSFITLGFLLFMLLTSNPFDRLFPAPFDGRDLNPLLQDPGLVIHPPMLYMGYVGFSVAFAFAVAALLGGELDSAWARWSRPWTSVAWLFLTLGIALGSWWAYYELGWGGWWFWDPVENASFMPWLVGTALMHSLAVTEKRGAFKNWTVLLAIIAFSLSLLGTFLVRSGVLTSVHAFATDPERGVFILMFLGIVVGISLALFAWRAPKVSRGASFSLISRESFMLMGNVLFLVVAGGVLLGTLYPLFMDALKLGKISVGPPYFDLVFFVIMLPLVLIMGIGPLLRWKQDSEQNLWRQIMILAVISIVLGIAWPMLTLEQVNVGVVLGIMGAIWITLSVFWGFYKRLQNNNGLANLPRSFYAMSIAHLGMAVFIVGVTMVKNFEIERDVRMAPGEPILVGEYQFEFSEVRAIQGPNYDANRGHVVVSRDGEQIAVLEPEKRNYHSQTMPMTEAAISPGLFRDIYVALGEPIGGGAWAVRVYYKPFIRWIWLGALFMAFGGLLAALDKRYRRLAKKDVSAALVMASPKPATA